MRFTRLAVAILALSVSAASFAWNETGHMVIAAIAEGNLNEKAWKECDRLIKIEAPGEYKGMIAGSLWAEFAPAGKPEWHFNAAGVRFDGKKATVTPAPENAVWAVNHFSEILKDKTKPDAERAEALRYILSIGADLHQPLHAATLEDDAHPNGDNGGVDFAIKIEELFPGNDRPQNLHALWDMALGGFVPGLFTLPLGVEGEGRVRILAQNFMSRFTKKMFAEPSKNIDPASWAKESYDIAANTAYKLPTGGLVDLTYAGVGKSLASSRAVLAGYRIAELLNKIVGS
jgi:hypothetical protein